MAGGRIVNADRLAQKLARHARGLDVTPALKRGAEATRAYVVDSVNEGGAQVPHQPSKPGEPPNTDTGRYVGSMGTDSDGRNHAEMYSHTEYGEPLEYGTDKMAPRPHMRPAYEVMKGPIIQDVIAEAKKRLRGQ